MSIGRARMAGLALVAVTAAGCGSDNGNDSSASDATSASTSTSTSPSTSATPSTSDSATPTTAPSTSGDPVPSPVINKAVKDAIADDFPALVPAGVPDGWTVVKAHYSPKRGGQWWIDLTDPNGAAVSLAQSKKDLRGIVNQYAAGAQPAGDVDLSAYGTGTWSAYSGGSGAALGKSLSGTAAVLVGPDQATLVTLAQQLLTAEDSGSSDGG